MCASKWKDETLVIDLQLYAPCSDCVVPQNYICKCNLLLRQIGGSESVYDSLLPRYYLKCAFQQNLFFSREQLR